MKWGEPPRQLFDGVFVHLSPQDVAFRTSVLNKSWYRRSLAHLYRVIPPFHSAFQLSRACKTMIAHPQQVALSVLEISIVHTMQDIDKERTLYYTVRTALALCTNLEILYLHTDPSVARIILGPCTFRLKTFSIIDHSDDLPTVFLSHQDSLEELVIVRGAPVPLCLPKDALPNLTRFSGIPENVIRISQGRRLTTLRILPGPSLLNLSDTLSRLDPFAMSSLTEFHVLVAGSVLHHVTTVALFLPRLTALVVRYYQREVLFGALGSILPAFVNLRQYSMISLNVQAPMTPLALDSENSIVMLYYKKCPTLRAIILRGLCWVLIETHDQSYWCPRADNLHLRKMWEDGGERGVISPAMAEDALRSADDEISEDSSRNYVSMDLDTPSEEASDYGD
ncbi:hypothetical protein JB92DRAFT_3092886 [Gautieria morchelliformis]|nr:hypothetical protein JB92DRAFT_3092886 [Gautieria morchelliformis]